MGLLVDGVWQEDMSRTKDGHFVRPADALPQFRHRRRQPGPDRRGRISRRAGRYHLYVSLACPWAHRTLIFRKLKKLDDVISVSMTEPLYGKTGWEFGTDAGATLDTVERQGDARRDLSAGRSALQRPRQRAGAVGQEAADHRQ